MTNQELNDLLASFEESSLSKLKLSTQETWSGLSPLPPRR